MARVSFGSRAGSTSDYLTGNGTYAYHAQTVHGVFDTLQELVEALRKEIQSAKDSELPQLTTCELSLREGATLPLMRPTIGPYSEGGEHDLPAEFKTRWTDESDAFPGVGAILPKATITDILGAPEGQPRQIVQRAASRAIVQGLEASDGFKYSFNNAWAAKDEEGARFSYICQDSMQNKDRHANGFTKTVKHLKGEGERGPRKPTYDCKGSVSVKFSGVRRIVNVYYRHYAIHRSVAERRPVGRPPKSKTMTMYSPDVNGQAYASAAQAEPDAGGLFGQLQNEHSAFNSFGQTQAPRAEMPPPQMKPLKRKRGSEGPSAYRDPNKPMSLVELLQQSEAAKAPAANDNLLLKNHSNNSIPPPVDYALPSWQTPPSVPRNAKGYQPPYNPQQTPGRNLVAIPRKPKQTTALQQVRLGAPQGKVNPEAQGLFSTLKPVRKEEFTSYEPHFVMYQSHRAKTSCHNCRVSKKKCDEGRPICGACARLNKLDCNYEGPPNRNPSYTQQQRQQQQQPPQRTPTSATAQSATPESTTQTPVTPQMQSYQQYTPSAGSTAYPTQTQTYQGTPAAAAYSQGAQGYSQGSGQPYQSASSSQTFGASQAQGYGTTASQGQAKAPSPDPWFPRR